MSRAGEPLGPWWRERQLDPESPDFQPGGPPLNLTHRDWLQLGTVSTRERAVVDPRGLVTPTDQGWSLDWWIGADDRWHIPAREVGVRQQRLDDAPVVETAMRVPGGDAVHRVYATQSSSGPVLVVEIENRTAIPFAVGLAIVPYNAISDVAVRSVTTRETVVEVDGRPAVLLPRAPSRIATGCRGIVSSAVVDGLADVPHHPHTVTCDDGRAETALVYPLAHTAVMRVVLPMRPTELDGDTFLSLATAAEVQRGWTAQVERGPRIDLPDDRLRNAFEAARRDLLLVPAGEDLLSWPNVAVPWTTSALVMEALDVLGFHDEVEEVLRGVPDEQRLDGGVASPDDGLGANGAVLRAIGLHWQLTRDGALVERLVGPIAKAGHWIEKRRTARRRPLLAEARYLDGLWSVAGLWAAVPALAAIDQPEVVEDLTDFGSRLLSDIHASMEADSAQLGFDVPPLRPGHPFGVDALCGLEAVWLVDLLADARLDALADLARARWLADGLIVDPSGWGVSPRRTIELAAVGLLAGDPCAVEGLVAVLDHSSSVRTWPEVVHPRSGGGALGSGHDPATIATLCTFVRRMLVREHGWLVGDRGGPRPVDAHRGLALCSLVPDGWLGQPWEVHDLPTTVGRLGFAVRWHGDRPALLWQLDPHEGVDPVAITAPGLDPHWSSSELRGEASSAPVPPPEPPRADPGGTEASSSFA